MKFATGRRDIQFVGVMRVVAVAFGLLCVALLILGTLGMALVILALLGIVHTVRRRMGKPLTLVQSWVTAMTAAIVLIAGATGWALSQRDQTGTTFWHRTVTAAEQADPNAAPPPAILRYLPGGYVQPPPLPKAMNGPLMAYSFVFGIGIFGAIIGSLTWGAAWVVVSGWIGRFAGIGVVDEPRAQT